MRIDFYQLSRDPVERVVPLLAGKALDSGARVLLVCADEAQRGALSTALWAQDDAFLAHGPAGGAHAARQPVLLDSDCTGPAANGAGIVMLADGLWRPAAAEFVRAILLFGAEHTGAARALWADLSGGAHDLRIFKQGETGAWREGR